MIRVYIVDDADRIRRGLRMRLSLEPDLTIVGDGSANPSTLGRVAEADTDVVLLGASRSRDGYPNAADLVPQLADQCAVVALCMPDDLAMTRRLRLSGATVEYVSGDVEAELPDAIRGAVAERRRRESDGGAEEPAD